MFSALTISADISDVISIADMQHEGLTMDENGILYVVSENGGGNIDHPQLWVYAPPAPVPAPPAMWLRGSALGGVAMLRRRRAV